MELPEYDDYAGDFPKLAAIRIDLHLSGTQAMCLLGQLQLACRHPQNRGPTRQVAEEVARDLQVAVSITPALAGVAEAGWHEEYDQEWEE
jgi:hypothetical protein